MIKLLSVNIKFLFFLIIINLFLFSANFVVAVNKKPNFDWSGKYIAVGFNFSNISFKGLHILQSARTDNYSSYESSYFFPRASQNNFNINFLYGRNLSLKENILFKKEVSLNYMLVPNIYNIDYKVIFTEKSADKAEEQSNLACLGYFNQIISGNLLGGLSYHYKKFNNFIMIGGNFFDVIL
ncbi:hypothetical protein [Bartonella sp. DGB1]|uniref:hypothetical protein n=1 Tax=Bartonella sp. DGB1 TaxID=3239807 RepID=UPI003524E42B